MLLVYNAIIPTYTNWWHWENGTSYLSLHYYNYEILLFIIHFRTLYCIVNSIGILQPSSTDEIIFNMKYDYMNKRI